MRLVHKKAVNAQLLKGDNIILAAVGAQLVQLGFQRFAGALHLLNRKILSGIGFQLVDSQERFRNLILNNTLLPLKRKRDALKLRMTDDNGIVIAGGDAGAELFAVRRFKILAPCHKQFCVRVQMQKLRCPLLRQMIGNHEQAFLAQTQAFCFHCGCSHFKSFARAYFVCKQSITAIKHMSNGIALMLPERDFRVHPHKMNVTSIVFAGSRGVE